MKCPVCGGCMVVECDTEGNTRTHTIGDHGIIMPAIQCSSLPEICSWRNNVMLQKWYESTFATTSHS